MRMVKDNDELKVLLGEAIRPQPEWWLNGDPWVEGSVSLFIFQFRNLLADQLLYR